MKKILFLLLSTVAMYGQVPADATPLENIQITNNTQSTTATKVNVQENDGTINTISKSDLVNYLEFASAVNLPVTGEQGKLYLTKDNNRLYRFNGTIYQELTTDETTATIQAKRPLKTIENQSLEGSGNIDLSKSDVGLGNVDNTSDVNKPISTATQTALNGKENSFTKNTAFNKPFGTAAGTVVEGGTLGSNAYTSTDYFKYETFSADANSLPGNRSAFTYAINAPHVGPIAHFAADGYGMQINANSSNGDSFSFRTLNGDILAWNPWRKVWHDGNFNPANYLPLSGGSLSGAISGTSATFSGTVTAAPATLSNHVVVKSQLDAVGRPYKVYTALLNQTGTNAPVATVLENTLGGTIVWSYVSIGQYMGTLTGAFLSNKTVVFLTNVYGKYFLTGGRDNDNSVMIGTQAPNGGSTNGDLSNSSIEIRVYL